ncbi:bifunctional 3-deoxy-7-phosphoheptulonate synthase/chorismate mutase [Paenibacillus sp. UMB7766-LJ446]|uniref:Bifunctional 3-deoxy-7-phosphoheptulonate synthase/chorismate mutase n=1 Tax=Paenibacillus vandeheii TaxID=3035917 RepID=A0ABT8JED0_9BACL|nr:MULTISPECIES: bifunctional 3-deoxy-7-phosphoheptulonate synthase/chorismate mutase [Paenibacillus]OPG99819.1 bifunctional 3-deoxy-7-phosphoheptulonate synthase/chorismate mutase [Chryseobacterium mucoviscidosis]KGP78248.1 chorismate mutase [Paenibacillus sp. MAEPY2]KGP87030.1 chorismate mutase [Paenibacillus sp. MAEPY1]MDK8190862.1 bifunctional 3-deoxy-7-phosphoheptulonate synthase/chorismate mutase [Paenibacillus sp. UMB7766-LJ446]MDN4603460.1 bifunctional 3-deoxy-7-phosphoheptulonate synt
MDQSKNLEQLRGRLSEINHNLLHLLSERAQITQEIGQIKEKQGVPKFDPVREKEMLEELTAANPGPFQDDAIKLLFKQIFQASLNLQVDEHKKQLLVSRKNQQEDTVVSIGNVKVGAGKPIMIAGPCSVESYEQVREVAAALKAAGITVMRGGAFKPRTSPYDFQGLGIEGLKILKEVADEFGLKTISEIVHPSHIELAGEYIDVIQIGARNMQNFELLKAAGDVNIPILLKRGLSATIDEFVHAAEYVVSRGNKQVMLIERGIRTYEKATRNTLDISAVPILKQETHLPVLVDVTHSTGRKDILAPCAKAALAAGADGVMVEVHPNPAVALSDSAQQLNIEQFNQFLTSVRQSGLLKDQ